MAATNVGGGLGLWGGTPTLTGLGGITAIDLYATAPTGARVEFAVDNVSVPAPGAAPVLGLIGLGVLRRRR